MSLTLELGWDVNKSTWSKLRAFPPAVVARRLGNGARGSGERIIESSIDEFDSLSAEQLYSTPTESRLMSLITTIRIES